MLLSFCSLLFCSFIFNTRKSIKSVKEEGARSKEKGEKKHIIRRMEQGAWSTEQGAKSMEQGARSNEKEAKSMEQGAMSKEQKVWSKEHGAWSMEHESTEHVP